MARTASSIASTRRRRLVGVAVVVVGLIGSGSVAIATDGTLEWISQSSGIADSDSDDVTFAGASADGSRVFLRTTQPLTAADGDTSRGDIYERSAGQTTLLSAPTGIPDPDGSDVSFAGASDDGSRVFLQTSQQLTADDTDTVVDVYERSAGQTTLLSAPTGVADPGSAGAFFTRASADGSRVFFTTSQKFTADDIDTGRVDVYERSAGQTTLVSAPTGVPDPDSGDVNFVSGASADGSRVFFETSQRLTAADGDTDRFDVYERSAGQTTLLSGSTGIADPDSAGVVFKRASADGSRVFFETSQRLTAADGDTDRNDVYERSAGQTTLVSAPTGIPDADTANAFVVGASADGSRVFLQTGQQLTADDIDTGRLDVYERSAGQTTLVSAPTGVPDPDTANASFVGASADGSRVFLQTSQLLTAADGDTGRNDVYERSAGQTTLVSAPTGVPDPDTDTVLFEGASADGSRVFFETNQRLTAADGDTSRLDVYERSAGQTTLLSTATGIPDPDTDIAFFARASALGNRVFFETNQQLAAADGDQGRSDVYAAGSPDPPPPGPAPPPSSPGPGQGPPAPGGNAVPASPDRTAPQIRLLRITSRFAASRALPKASLTTGALITYTLSERASTRLTFARTAPGRRSGRRCLPASGGRPRGQRCTRLAPAAGTITVSARNGQVRVRFAGRIDARRTLKPGTYRLTAIATDAAGNRSKPATRDFTLLPAARGAR